MDVVKEVCFWVVVAEVASAIVCVLVAPWVYILRNHKTTQSVGQQVPLPIQGTPLTIQRHRCLCKKLLRKEPTRVEVTNTQTIGVWNCKCGQVNKIPL